MIRGGGAGNVANALRRPARPQRRSPGYGNVGLAAGSCEFWRMDEMAAGVL